MNPEAMKAASAASPDLGCSRPPSIVAARAGVPGGLVAHSCGSPRRAAIEDFVRRAFLEHFDARIKHFMPTLLAMHEPGGEVRAAVGLRGAAYEPLFLETYTRQPIELMIAAKLGVRVPRSRIVEVGSLACRGGRAAMEIVTALIPWLIGAGYSWVVFTGADTVLNVFSRLRLEPQPLCPADKSLLGEQQYDWGSYYDHDPIVMAGRLADGVEMLEVARRVQ